MKILSTLLELFYPSTCIICRRGVNMYGTLCPSCLQNLPRTEHQYLRENKVEMKFEEIHPTFSLRYRNRFVRGGSWLHYNDEVASLIHSVKYREQPELGRYLGRQAAAEWQDSGFFDDIDLLVPVPIHSRRLRGRGYNQSEYICLGLADVLRLPIDADNLIRVVDTPQQALLTDTERRTNVAHAFKVQRPEAWHKKHILLVDDVITTGSTLLSCIKEITPIRTCRISVFSLASPS